MKSIYVFCISVLLTTVISCKQDEGSQTTATATENPQNAAGTTQQPQGGASSATEGHDYTFLTDKILHYEAAFGGKKDAKEQPFKDEWIDMLPDGTFKAGKHKEQTHTGKWSYNHDTRLLRLIPDNTKFPSSEWKVMFNEQMIVWVGTQTFGNSNTQIKLVRKDGLPE